MSAPRKHVAIATIALSCSEPPGPAPPPNVSVASAAVSGSAAPTTTASVTRPPPVPTDRPSALEVALAKLPPLKLTRRSTPAARFGAVKEACESGDAAACWSAAARFAGEGRLAG
ncbi:MAG: hypothetical protein U0414_26435, partial [Polyangiaceae bacterium]